MPSRELINIDRLVEVHYLSVSFSPVHRFQELDLSTQCLMGQESNREEPWVNTVEATLQKEGKYKGVSVWGVEGRVGCVGGGGEGGMCGRWRGGWDVWGMERKEGWECGGGGEGGMCEGWREGWDVGGGGESECGSGGEGGMCWGSGGESGCIGMLGECGSCVPLPAVVLCSSGGDTSAGVHQASSLSVCE